MAEGQQSDLDLFDDPLPEEYRPGSPEISIQSFERGSYRSSLPEYEKRTPTAISKSLGKRRSLGSIYGGKRTRRTEFIRRDFLDSSDNDKGKLCQCLPFTHYF